MMFLYHYIFCYKKSKIVFYKVISIELSKIYELVPESVSTSVLGIVLKIGCF